MKFIGIIFFSLFMTACVSTGGEKVTDFTDRSVIYGWLDIDDVDANNLYSVIVYQYVPKTDKPYFHVKVKEFEDGFLYYSFAFPNGSFGTYSAEGQYCLGLCSNTVYTYEFGKQGDDYAKVRISEPGVYSLGSYKLKEVDTGLFEQGKFEIVPTKKAPSNYKLLEEMLKDAQDNPVIAARIRAAMHADEI